MQIKINILFKSFLILFYRIMNIKMNVVLFLNLNKLINKYLQISQLFTKKKN